MTRALTLRTYQEEAVTAAESAWASGILRPALVLATGLGKTRIAAEIMHREVNRGGKPLFLVHRDELAQQTLATVRAFDPGLGVGLVKAEHDDTHAQVVVGSVQTLARAGRRGRLDGVTLVVVDEAHHASARTYVEILEHYGCFRDVRALGVTATMSRSDDRGLGDVWQEVVFKRDILFGIREGFLVDVRGTSIAVEGLDLEKVKRSRGDYQDSALGDALIEAGAGSVVARAYREHADGRQGVLFAPTVAAARAFADSLNAAGIAAETVTGDTPLEERALIYKRTRHGDTQVLSSVGVLCLDEETEILTDTGWVGPDQMTPRHRVANWDEGKVFFKEPYEVVIRDRGADEAMYVLETGRRSIRVTSRHRMLFRTSRTGPYSKAPVDEIAGRAVRLPVTGWAEPASLAPDQESVPDKGHRSRLVAATAYNLREREGYGRDASLEEAKRRIDRRHGLKYKSPHELTLAECSLIGFWCGDGSKNMLQRSGVEYTLSQSTAYPRIIEWIDKTLADAGIDAVCRDRSGYEVPHIRWSLPRGTGSGTQERDGVYALEPYLVKDGSPLLWGLDGDQFDALLTGFWYADGNHGKAEQGRPGAFHIAKCNYRFLSLLQAIAVVRGWNCSLREYHRPRKENHRQLYRLSFSRRTVDHSLDRYRIQQEAEPFRPERVWCVRTETRNIVTRRRGTVTVMGNTEGFDMPQLSCCVIARPTQSHGLYVQMAGRVLRPHPGKRDALLLDVVGASEGKSLRSIVDLTETGVRPKPGELLGEAAEREESEGCARDASVRLRLDAAARDLDLFTSSHAAWLQTKRGVWFVPTREHTYFLWPDGEGGAYKIGRCGVYSAKGGEWLMDGLSLDLAMSWAEQYAEEEDPMVASRNASWRTKKSKPSEAQVALAVRTGLPYEGLTKNELSNLVSVHYASKILDRAVS